MDVLLVGYLECSITMVFHLFLHVSILHIFQKVYIFTLLFFGFFFFLFPVYIYSYITFYLIKKAEVLVKNW